jgi:hypothetical protein
VLRVLSAWHDRGVRVLRLLLVVTLLTTGCAAAGLSAPRIDRTCFGAAALAAPAGRCVRDTRSGPLTPSAARAPFDRSRAYPSVSGGRSCFAVMPAFRLTTCVFGSPEARVSVALVGNSHAAQWLPAVERIAAQEGWRVTTYLSSQCALADLVQGFQPASTGRACLAWSRAVVDRVTHSDVDLVLMSNKLSRGVPGLDLAASAVRFRYGYERVLRGLLRTGVPIVGIRDTPSPAFQVPACLAAHPQDYRACSGPRSVWLPTDSLGWAVAAVRDPRVVMVDLTDHICERETCAAVVGGVPVYFDVSHLTATYAETLAPYLRAAIDTALADQARRIA